MTRGSQYIIEATFQCFMVPRAELVRAPSIELRRSLKKTASRDPTQLLMPPYYFQFPFVFRFKANEGYGFVLPEVDAHTPPAENLPFVNKVIGFHLLETYERNGVTLGIFVPYRSWFPWYPFEERMVPASPPTDEALANMFLANLVISGIWRTGKSKHECRAS